MSANDELQAILRSMRDAISVDPQKDWKASLADAADCLEGLMAPVSTDPPTSRAETSVMQFGDDWPGIFIRGDNAKMFELSLAIVLALVTRLLSDGTLPIEERVAVSAVRGLYDLLRQADKFARGNENVYIQYLKAFEQCWVKEMKQWQATPPSET